MQIVLADVAVSVSELEKNPSSVLSGANGAPVVKGQGRSSVHGNSG